jgi:hypothetical protein
MKPIRKAPFEKLAATLEAEQQQRDAQRQAKPGMRDYMPADELEDAEAANTQRVSQVYSEKKSE